MLFVDSLQQDDRFSLSERLELALTAELFPLEQ
jgi:hypothetical protein